MTSDIWGLLGPSARYEALGSGLLNLGGGLLAAGAPSNNPALSSRGLIAGTQGFNQGIEDYKRSALQSLLVGKQMDEEKRKEAERAARAAALKALIEQRPELANLAAAAPEQVTGHLVGQAFPDPSKGFSLSPGQTRFGSDSKPVASLPDLVSPDREAQLARIRAAGATNVQTSVNQGPQFGTIPPGYQIEAGPGGYKMTPIPGGPADIELKKEAEKKAGAAVAQERGADIVQDEVRRSLDIIRSSTLPTTGAVGQALSNLGGTAANDLRAKIDTIKSNASFDRLQQMRNNSPTGGALGNVSDAENRLLAATIGSLEQSQTRGDLEYNLQRVSNVYNDIVHGKGKGPDRYKLLGPQEEKKAPKRIDLNGNEIK